MVKSSGGTGRGGGGGSLSANATGGTIRTIAGNRYNTADVVNRAISEGTNDMVAARNYLITTNDPQALTEGANKIARDAALRQENYRRALREIELKPSPRYRPTASQVRQVATEQRVLSNIARITNSNTIDQIGKWNMSSAQTVLDSFDSYLNRRVSGQHARWTAKSK